MTPEKLQAKTSVVHPEKQYDYSHVDFSINVREKVLIGCPVEGHGLFSQTIDGHLSGREGCPACDRRNRLTTTEEFITKAQKVHGDTYDYSNLNLTNGQYDDIDLTCMKHGDFVISPWYHLQGYACPKCVIWGRSSGEDEVGDFVQELGFSIERNNRKVLRGKEIDIYLPDEKVGIEYNGLYWHAEKYVGKDLHKLKADRAEEAGIRLLQVWEDDWQNKKEQVKSHIRHVLGVGKNKRIFARSCTVERIDRHVSRDFLNDNHIQGFSPSSVYLGLYFNEELVAVASFLKDGQDYVLSRYATSSHVIGGHSKLVSNFERQYEYNNLVTFADRCFSNGALYEKTGWTYDKTIPHDYAYIVANKRNHKFNFRLKRFKDDPMLTWKPGLTEKELAELNGLSRIWDAGKIRYIKKRA